MTLRLLESHEVHEVLDEAQAFYDEHFPDGPPLHRSHFQAYWEYSLLMGTGLIFVASDELGDWGTFGCLRSQNQFTGEPEYLGAFTAIKPRQRGTYLILDLMNAVMDFLKHVESSCPFYLEVRSINPNVAALWRRLQFDQSLYAFRRRVC